MGPFDGFMGLILHKQPKLTQQNMHVYGLWVGEGQIEKSPYDMENQKKSASILALDLTTLKFDGVNLFEIQ